MSIVFSPCLLFLRQVLRVIAVLAHHWLKTKLSRCLLPRYVFVRILGNIFLLLRCLQTGSVLLTLKSETINLFHFQPSISHPTWLTFSLINIQLFDWVVVWIISIWIPLYRIFIKFLANRKILPELFFLAFILPAGVQNLYKLGLLEISLSSNNFLKFWRCVAINFHLSHWRDIWTFGLFTFGWVKGLAKYLFR